MKEFVYVKRSEKKNKRGKNIHPGFCFPLPALIVLSAGPYVLGHPKSLFLQSFWNNVTK